jgi:hypothetical protein
VKLDWVIVAEGLGTDAKGAVTAIGVDQAVLIAPEVPTTTKRAIIARLVEDEETALTAGTTIQFSLAIRSPSGKVLSAQSGGATIGAKLFPELPGSVVIPAEVGIAANEYGTYDIEVTASAPGMDEVSGTVPLYVVPPRGVDPTQANESAVGGDPEAAAAR